MKKSESVILSAGTEAVLSSNITKAYNKQLRKFNPLSDFKSTLENAADHFIRKHNGKYEIVAGLPWFGRWGRDTFISLPGLCLSRNQIQLFKSILNSFIRDSKKDKFPNLGYGDEADYKSVDTSLWFFWTLQKFIDKTDDFDYLHKHYYKKMKSILNSYRSGGFDGVELKDNALIWIEKNGKALTWMDAVVDGVAVSPRYGFVVEINALWYNAIKFSLEIAQKFNDEKFINEWTEIADKIPAEFKATFWSKHKGYLADYVYNDFQDWSVRPNMLFAASLKYSPVSEKIQQLILQAIKMDLLTIRGLRTLSPQNPDYKGECFGNQVTRDSEYHQGTIWPWLLGHYVEANLKIFGENAVSNLEWHLEHFEDVLMEHGIGTISEIYDGNPPHAARGTISQAWSVAEILRSLELIESFNKQKSES
jgi:predicted glycogen debranching enzyme